ncbi:MAG: hypothetical protein Q9201_007970, partial [Fulgogasparrea decipioides]
KHSQNTWNESQFHTDRTNNPGQPPWAPRQLTLAEQEEADMQKAMALSTSQFLPAQETGVTAAEKPYFGPVRHEYHDTKNWIMTTSKATAKEILLNPEPKDRQRQPDTPAFLRPSPAGHRLPGLVKVLHAIPAAREALLSRECLKAKYEHHNEWWDGVPIQSPQVIHGEEDHDTPPQEIIHEGQRLIAFLDDTERAYGSAEALTALPGLRDCTEDCTIKEFPALWYDAALRHTPAAPLNHIFQSTGARARGEYFESEDITVLDLEIHQQLFEPGQTLYDALDSLLWPNRDGSDPEEIFLEKVADVLVIRVFRGDVTAKSLDIKVPAVWYSDRYRRSSQPRIHQMLADKVAIKDEIDELEARKQRASAFKSSRQSDKPVEVNHLLQTAQQHFIKGSDYFAMTNGIASTETEQEGPKSEAYRRIAEELKVLSERVAARLQAFEESRDKAREKLRELSKLFTEPSDIPGETPHDKYTLRGVCAEPETVYVQERSKPDDEDEVLIDAPAADHWQWWRLSYDAHAAQPTSCNKVREIEVLKAVRDGPPSAILVYASEQAMSVENKELPPQLKSFVQTDNLAFAAELASSDHQSPPPDNEDPNSSSTPLPSYNDINNQQFSPPPTAGRDKSYDEYIP